MPESPDTYEAINRFASSIADLNNICNCLLQATKERNLWETTAHEYAVNATYWQEQAEQARSKLTGMTTAMQHWRWLAGSLTQQLGPDAED